MELSDEPVTETKKHRVGVIDPFNSHGKPPFHFIHPSNYPMLSKATLGVLKAEALNNAGVTSKVHVHLGGMQLATVDGLIGSG